MKRPEKLTARSRRPALRALELLASCPHEGCAEAVMIANRITIAQMVELVRTGLATAT
jgi:hypothetical protein